MFGVLSDRFLLVITEAQIFVANEPSPCSGKAVFRADLQSFFKDSQE
jgi:hypothetical protein